MPSALSLPQRHKTTVRQDMIKGDEEIKKETLKNEQGFLFKASKTILLSFITN